MARKVRVRRTQAAIAEANAITAAARAADAELYRDECSVLRAPDPQRVRHVRPVDPDDVRRPVLHAQAQLAAPLAMLAGRVALPEQPGAFLEALVHRGLGGQRWLSLSGSWARGHRLGRLGTRVRPLFGVVRGSEAV